MTDTVKMPEPVDFSDAPEHAHVYGYTEAQLKQYGDDRARDALEKAALIHDEHGDCQSTISEAIRALKEQIK